MTLPKPANLAMRKTSIVVTITIMVCCALAAFEGGKEPQNDAVLFTVLSPAETGVNFTNKLEETDSLHVLNYEYLYNGNGVGVGDFNNDGLPDLFFSGNTVQNKLYLNKGKLKFEDITSKAGVAGNGTWSTGVSIADVNGDGLLDIYVCHSGKLPPEKLVNELFINQGVPAGSRDGAPTFINKAKEYGLDAPGTQSTQAAFFDYDLDGDLDMFLLNHSVKTYNPLLNTRKTRSTPSLEYGNRLFRNDSENGKILFTDVTREAGIVNNPINYGLSVTISDLNGDGWADIYTTSDYAEQDYCYINNKNGTFRESIRKSFTHISQFSMGADVADYNNDLRPDVMTLDMLPEDNRRQKLLKGADEYDQYHLLVDSGYHHQTMRNMLHLNQGEDERGDLRFSEIGQLAGVSNTDWSWSALFADVDNDGWKDLFISNGYLRDYTNMDFLKYTVADARIDEAQKGNIKFRTFDLVKKMPSTKLSNYIFRNNHDLTFTNATKQWGLYRLSVSNSAVYADLDNDGDLDMIINHQNEPASIYRNNAETQLQANYLNIRLKGRGDNTFALGAKVLVVCESNGISERQLQELYPVRGYQSSVDYTLHFGLGTNTTVKEVKIFWADGSESILSKVAANQILTINQNDAKLTKGTEPFDAFIKQQAFLSDITKQSGLNFTHIENDFVDFKSEFLLPYQLSRMGPALATADVNGDGLDDVFLGGAMEQASALYLQQNLQQSDGKKADFGFALAPVQAWKDDNLCDVVGALFFDADGDGDKDLYLAFGGNEPEPNSVAYQDKLYLNDGKGRFVKATDALPSMPTSTQAIAAGDFDGDGDVDLFVGGRCQPGSFPFAGRSYLLRNDSKNGSVRFTDVTESVCKDLLKPGMVTSAAWQDMNGDKLPDLVLAGDWMPVKLFLSERDAMRQGGTTILRDASQEAGLLNTSGMWTTITMSDLDGDGDMDMIIGNCGVNSQFHISKEQPMQIFARDFDNNGVVDPILCYYVQGKKYPYPSRDELLEQITPLRRKFVKYADYADATLETIFPKEQVAQATVFTCDYAATSVFWNDGKGRFTIKALPIMAQFSKVHGIVVDDFNRDGRKDILCVGNFYPYRTQMGRCDAGLGVLLYGTAGYGTEKGNFIPQMPYESGLYAGGDVRAIASVKSGSGGNVLVIAKNDEPVQVFRWKKP